MIRSVGSFAAAIGAAALAVVGAGLFVRLAAAPPAEIVIAAYATDLNGRTASQRHNARLAADAINGKVIPPGAAFSFNHTVKSWSVDAGYVKAPVSYEGEMVRAFGGGVCQTSSTLYNVALRAGLPILERHSHVFAAHYVPPGQDAAVAHPTIDLRFRNPYRWPIRIAATARFDRLEVRILGAAKPASEVTIVSDILEQTRPERMTRVVAPRDPAARTFFRNPGATGCRVVTYRIFSRSGREIRRERLSDDTYEVMDKLTQVAEDR